MKFHILVLTLFSFISLIQAQVEKGKDAPEIQEEAFEKLSTHELAIKVLEINLRVNQIMLKLDGGDEVIEKMRREINQEISDLQRIQKIIISKPGPKDSEIKEFTKFLITMNREVAGLKKRLPLITVGMNKKALAVFALGLKAEEDFNEVMETVFKKYPDEKLSKYMKEILPKSAKYRTLIEVHQVDEYSKNLSPSVYAHRQAEILLSRNNLSNLSDRLKLQRRWNAEEDLVFRVLEEALSYEVTEGGLISISLLFPYPKTGDGELILNHLVKSYSDVKRDIAEVRTLKHIKHVKELRRVHEDTKYDMRDRYLKIFEKYEIKTDSDINNASNENRLKLDFVRADLSRAQSIVRNLKDKETALADAFIPDYLTVHSKAYLVEAK